MKKTNKVKMGPLGTPLGNPLGYFNSLKGKKTEPKQTLRKAQDGIEMNGYGEDTNMMIDKPGYSGGFKAPVRPKLGYISGRPGEGTPGIFTPPPYIKNSPYEEYDEQVKEYYKNGQNQQNQIPTPGQMYGPPPQSKGGSTNMMKKGGSHKMPNGKMMLNSAMKKGGLVKKKK